MQIRSKIWIEKRGKLVFGKGKSDILKAVQRYGSINKAAEAMGISFRHAWSYINEIEDRMGVKLIERARGGKGGGGSHLTGYANEFITRYDRLKKEVDKYTDKRFREAFAKWKNVKSLK